MIWCWSEQCLKLLCFESCYFSAPFRQVRGDKHQRDRRQTKQQVLQPWVGWPTSSNAQRFSAISTSHALQVHQLPPSMPHLSHGVHEGSNSNSNSKSTKQRVYALFSRIWGPSHLMRLIITSPWIHFKSQTMNRKRSSRSTEERFKKQISRCKVSIGVNTCA